MINNFYVDIVFSPLHQKWFFKPLVPFNFSTKIEAEAAAADYGFKVSQVHEKALMQTIDTANEAQNEQTQS